MRRRRCSPDRRAGPVEVNWPGVLGVVYCFAVWAACLALYAHYAAEQPPAAEDDLSTIARDRDFAAPFRAGL